MKNLDKFFKPENVAVIGVSKNPEKVGHVIFRNMLNGFGGKVFPINPNAESVLNRVCYKSVTDIKEKIDMAVIAIPAKLILNVIKDCGQKKIKHVVIISAGFGETGNDKLQNEVKKLLNKFKINVIGPNVLGILDAYSKVDCLFIPQFKMQRPNPGGIGFISQSGALGTAILDLVASKDIGFSKFISYGNAINTDESDLIEYLGDDPETKVICLYIEGVKDGKRFMEVCKKVSEKKPIIAIKGGKTNEGGAAALSHTGSLAGDALIYSGVFKQCNIISADSLEEMFDYALILDMCVKPKGKKIMVLTDGGGYGIISADEIIENGLELSELNKNNVKELKKLLPPIVSVRNPLDIIGDSDVVRYDNALSVLIDDPGIDIILVVVLFQLPLIDDRVVETIVKYNNMKLKPMIVISTGGKYVENINKKFINSGIPCYQFPYSGVKAVKKLVEYYS
tara:strand:+ start:12224 stop:13579 length:1356 start_codon:yes stop_codon:yes gene_type:complete